MQTLSGQGSFSLSPGLGKGNLMESDCGLPGLEAALPGRASPSPSQLLAFAQGSRVLVPEGAEGGVEIQKTSNSQSDLEKEEWNWRNQPT